MMNGAFLGTVMGWFIWVRPGNYSGGMEIFQEPPSALRGIKVILRRVVRMLSLHCEFYKMRKEQWL